jgi:hypothetical protein
MRPARTAVSAIAASVPLDSSHASPPARPMRRVTACLVLLRSWEELARTTSDERALPGRAVAAPRWSVCSMMALTEQGCDRLCGREAGGRWRVESYAQSAGCERRGAAWEQAVLQQVITRTIFTMHHLHR